MSYRETHARLAAAQKTRRGGPAYSVYVNRPLGRRAAAVAFLLGLSPNSVTAISAGSSFAAIVVLAAAPNLWTTGVLVAALLVIGYALDAADGQLARLRGGGSLAGEWLDHMVDSAKIISLHSAVLIHLFRSGETSSAWFLVPIGFGVVAVVLFFAQLLNEQLRRRGPSRQGPQGPGRASMLVALVKLPHDYGVLCLVFLLLGSLGLFLWVYAALFVANTGYLLLASVKWFRELQATEQ